jgi:hypothetical protein
MLDSLLNYNTEDLRLEVIDSYIKGIFDLNKYDFIESDINDGNYVSCNFFECDVKNIYAEMSSFKECDIINSKLTNCKVNSECVLEKVYFYGGYMDGEMKSGIFRGGTIGPNAVIGDGVKLVTDDENYFGTHMAGDISKGKKPTMKDIKSGLDKKWQIL